MNNFVVDMASATQNVPYEFKSIMHYGAYAGCIDATKPTIIPILKYNVSLAELGSSKLPTEYDYLHINLLYCAGNLCRDAIKIPAILLTHYSCMCRAGTSTVFL